MFVGEFLRLCDFHFWSFIGIFGLVGELNCTCSYKENITSQLQLWKCSTQDKAYSSSTQHGLGDLDLIHKGCDHASATGGGSTLNRAACMRLWNSTSVLLSGLSLGLWTNIRIFEYPTVITKPFLKKRRQIFVQKKICPLTISKYRAVNVYPFTRLTDRW